MSTKLAAPIAPAMSTDTIEAIRGLDIPGAKHVLKGYPDYAADMIAVDTIEALAEKPGATMADVMPLANVVNERVRDLKCGPMALPLGVVIRDSSRPALTLDIADLLKVLLAAG